MKPTTALAGVLGSLLVAVPGACRCAPETGGSCDAPRAVCAASAWALECVDGRMQPRSCRGSRGCREIGAGLVDCDDGLAIPGDPCRDLGVARGACSPDRSSELVCVGGRWQLVATCGGPKGCEVGEAHVDCDDSIAHEDDPCASEVGDVACSSDGSARLRCDAGRWRIDLACRGRRGCAVIGGLVHCDGAASTEGAHCAAEGDAVCSDDGGGILACRAGRFVAAHRCEPGRRCAARALVVGCE